MAYAPNYPPLGYRLQEHDEAGGWNRRSTEGGQPAQQDGWSLWAAERPLDRTRTTAPRRSSARQPWAPGLETSGVAPTPPWASSSGGEKGTLGETPSPSNRPLPFAARALPGAQSGPGASLPSPAPAGTRSRCAAPGAGSGGLAARPLVYPLRSSIAAAREAARRPCRAGALLSLVWNFYPPRKRQARAGAVGSGSPGRAVWPLGEGSGHLGSCGFRTQFRGQPSDFGSPGIPETNEGEGGIGGREVRQTEPSGIRKGPG